MVKVVVVRKECQTFVLRSRNRVIDTLLFSNTNQGKKNLNCGKIRIRLKGIVIYLKRFNKYFLSNWRTNNL